MTENRYVNPKPGEYHARGLTFARATIDEENRTVPLSVSSDTDQILRYVDGVGPAWEILAHDGPHNVDLSRFQGENGGPLLYNHDRSVLIGRFIPTGIADGKLRGVARFGRTGKAGDAWLDVQDGILQDTSVFYTYNPKDVTVTGQREGYPVAKINKWSLTETSMVPVPADTETGVGRAGMEPDATFMSNTDTPAQESQEPVSTGGELNPGGTDNSQDPDPEEDEESMRDPKCDDPECTDEEPCSRCAMGRGEDPDANVKKYGDVEFADEKDKKYPIDTKEHAKAAWDYINKQKDSDAYSAEDLKKVKDKIIAAYKKFFGEDPPSMEKDSNRSTTPSVASGQRSHTPNSQAVARPIEGGIIMPDNAAGNTALPEVTEAMKLRAIASQVGHAAKADELLQSMPLDQARSALMDHMAKNPITRTKSLEEMGASEKEIKSFNFGRALLGACDLATGSKMEASIEAEISDTLRKDMPSSYKFRGGIFLPYAMRSQRDTPLNTLTATQGAEAVFVEPGQVIDVLRNMLVTQKLGATIFTGLEAPLGLPRQDTDNVAYWVAENGASDVTESEMATSLVTLTPHTLQGTTAVTRQLLELAVKQFETQGRIINSISYASQKAIDAAALFGTGTAPQPQGIWTAPGVGTLAFNSAVTAGVSPAAPYTYQDLVQMVAKVANANVPFNKPAFVTNALLAGGLMSNLEFAVNGSAKIWEGDILEGRMCGLPAFSTQQVPNNLGANAAQAGLIFGSWDQLLIGLFGNGFEVIVDPYSMKKKGVIEITSFNMADVKIAHAAGFCNGTNMNAAGVAQSAM